MIKKEEIIYQMEEDFSEVEEKYKLIYEGNGPTLYVWHQYIIEKITLKYLNFRTFLFVFSS